MTDSKLQPTNWAANEVTLRPLAKLTPYDKNARTHSQAQILELAAAIEKWGWTQPIVVDEAGVILAGHARYEAARTLDLTQVPVVEAKGWTETEKRAYVLADNRIALNAGWDDELLHFELDALRQTDFDTSLLGWGCDLPGVDPELDMSILDQITEAEVDELEQGIVKFVTLGVAPEQHAELTAMAKRCREVGYDFTPALREMLRACVDDIESGAVESGESDA